MLTGNNVYTCVVCDRTLHSSVELVQHLIQHCDANTALKRQPQASITSLVDLQPIYQCIQCNILN